MRSDGPVGYLTTPHFRLLTAGEPEGFNKISQFS